MHKNYSKYEDSWARNVEISKEKNAAAATASYKVEREDIKCVRWMKEKHENFIFLIKRNENTQTQICVETCMFWEREVEENERQSKMKWLKTLLWFGWACVG